MPLLVILGTLLLAGFLLWVVKTAPFVDDAVKPIATWIVIVLVGLWLIVNIFGIANISAIRVGGG